MRNREIAAKGDTRPEDVGEAEAMGEDAVSSADSGKNRSSDETTATPDVERS